jgi:hypothetical protein
MFHTKRSIRHAERARRGQPEDDPVADALHAAQKLHEYLGYDRQLFGTQHVVEYQEETRSHQALTYDHNGAIGTWVPSALPAGHPQGMRSWA